MIRCDDTENDARLTPAAQAILRQVGTRSFVSIQVAFNGESHLTINVIMRSGPRKWLDEEIEVLSAAANHVRIALQRAELFDLVSQGKFEWEATFDALTDGIFIFDENGIVLTSEGAAGVVAVFLSDGDLSVKTKQEVNELGIIVEVSLRVLRPSQFREEDLRDAGGGGLEAHFGQLRGVLAAEEIHHVILVEAILEDVFLGE